MPNFLILEHCRHRPWFDEVQKTGSFVKDGYGWLGEEPGLGIELDWDYVNRHPYQHMQLPVMKESDGGLPLL